MKTAFLSHADCELHEMGAGHPESPQRLRAIRQYLERTELFRELIQLQATPVAEADILRVHPRQHLEYVRSESPSTGLVALDPDTLMGPDSLNAALLAAGAVTGAVDGIFQQRFTRAFCSVRPPGHHAEVVTAMGFCFFNNVAIGVRYAMDKYAVERVAVLDFDVHHGNGTVDIFLDNPSVLVCSSFQHPFYPYRYYDVERPNIVNTPLSAGTGSSGFRQAIERDWLPALERHQPEMIFVSAGFDAHKMDPLGQLNLVEDDYAWVTGLIVDAANRYSAGRVVSTLEGGYDLTALAASVAAHISVLADIG